MEQKNGSNGKNGSSKIAILLLCLVIVALIAVISFLFLNKPESKETEPVPQFAATADGRGVLLTPENVDEVLNAEKVDPDYFETNMTNEWHFVDGVANMSTVYLKNEVTNDKVFYFDLIIDDERTIYSSPYIPVGAEMTQFELTDVPNKGTYDGTVKYHFVDDENKEVSDVSIAVTVYIE